MTARAYVRGHEVYYDEEEKEWRYNDNHTPINNNRPCSKCDKQPIDDVDFCLYGLHDCDFIVSACCGHGVEIGFILLKDGRVFEEVGGDSDD